MAATVNEFKRTRVRYPGAVDDGLGQFVVPSTPPVFDTFSQTQDFNSASTTISHTCTGSDLVLYVACYLHEQSGTQDAPTGVTYNTVAMTKIGEATVSPNSNWTVWRLINPATGANDIVGTFSEDKNQIFLGGFSYTNVDQTTSEDTSVTATGYNGDSGTNINQDVTTVTDDALAVVCFNSAASVSPSVQGSETERNTFTFSSIDMLWGDILKETAGTQNVGVDYSSTPTVDKMMISFGIRPVT